MKKVIKSIIILVVCIFVYKYTNMSEKIKDFKQKVETAQNHSLQYEEKSCHVSRVPQQRGHANNLRINHSCVISQRPIILLSIQSTCQYHKCVKAFSKI